MAIVSPKEVGDKGEKGGEVPQNANAGGKIESPAYGTVSKGETEQHKN